MNIPFIALSVTFMLAALCYWRREHFASFLLAAGYAPLNSNISVETEWGLSLFFVWIIPFVAIVSSISRWTLSGHGGHK